MAHAAGPRGNRQTARHGVHHGGCGVGGGTGSETGSASGAGGSKVYYSYRGKQHSLLNSGALKVHVSYRESHTLYSTRAPPAPRARLTGDGSAWRAPPPRVPRTRVCGAGGAADAEGAAAAVDEGAAGQRALRSCGLALLRAPAYCPLLNEGRTGRAASLLAPRRRPRRCARPSSPGPCTPAWHMHGMCMVYAWHMFGTCTCACKCTCTCTCTCDMCMHMHRTCTVRAHARYLLACSADRRA